MKTESIKLEKASKLLADDYKDNDDLLAFQEVKRLKAKNKKLLEYVHHKPDCPLFDIGVERCIAGCPNDVDQCLRDVRYKGFQNCDVYNKMKCTCGLDKLLKEV